MPTKVCRDCRTRQELEEFPTDKYGRPDPRFCYGCLDEHAPVLLTESEAAERLDVTIEAFRNHNLKPAGSYTPPGKGAVIHLYARADVDVLRRAAVA